MKNVGLLWRKTSTDLSGDQIVPDRKPDEFREVRQFQFVHDVVTVSRGIPSPAATCLLPFPSASIRKTSVSLGERRGSRTMDSASVSGSGWIFSAKVAASWRLKYGFPCRRCSKAMSNSELASDFNT